MPPYLRIRVLAPFISLRHPEPLQSWSTATESFSEPGPWLPASSGPHASSQTAWQAYGRQAVLFLLTAVAIVVTPVDLQGRPVLREGLLLAAGLLSILVAHEMGHYLACRYYGIDASLPYFIPAPLINPLAGTLGAVIRIRDPFPHRRALFDVGIAGPLAGFVVCLPVLWLGVLEAELIPIVETDATISLAEPLLFQWAVGWLRGTLPAGHTLMLGPLGMAAWFGLLVTALNLIPVGQLDGGHVIYALLRGHAWRIARWVWWGCVALIFFAGPQWILWSVLMRVLGLRHAPTLRDGMGVGKTRVAVGLVGLAVFAVTFVPSPIAFSWQQVLDLLA